MGETKCTGEIDYADVQRTMRLAAEMNTGWHTDDEVRGYLREITGSDIPDTVRVFTPLHINYGRTTRFGNDCFVNFDRPRKMKRTALTQKLLRALPELCG